MRVKKNAGLILHNYKCLIILFFSFLIYSCDRSDNQNVNHNVITYNINLDKKNVVNLVKFKSQIKLIKIDRNKIKIGKIGSVVKTNNFIIVYDIFSKKIIKLTLTGGYLGIIGNYGQGPGEHLEVVQMDYDSSLNTLTTLDIQRRLIVYNLDSGQAQVNKKMTLATGTYFSIFDDKYYVFEGLFVSGKEGGHQVSILDKSFKKISEDIPFKKGSGMVFGPVFPLQKSDNQLYCMPVYEQKIYKLINKKFVEFYNFDFDKYNIPVKKLVSDRRYLFDSDWLTNNKNMSFVMFLNYFMTKYYTLITLNLYGNPKIVVCEKNNSSNSVIRGFVDMPYFMSNQPVGMTDTDIIFAVDAQEIIESSKNVKFLLDSLGSIDQSDNQTLFFINFKSLLHE